MLIKTKFDFGQVVFFALDKSAKGIISKIIVEPNSCVNYCVTWEDKRALWHYEFELELINAEEWSHAK